MGGREVRRMRQRERASLNSTPVRLSFLSSSALLCQPHVQGAKRRVKHPDAGSPLPGAGGVHDAPPQVLGTRSAGVLLLRRPSLSR